MDQRFDTIVSQKFPKRVALWSAHDVLMPDVGTIVRSVRQVQSPGLVEFAEPHVVLQALLLPLPIPAIEVRQFYAKERRLDRIQPIVESTHVMLVFHGRTVIPEFPHAVGQIGVAGRHCPGIPERTQVLARVEAERGPVPKRTHGGTGGSCPMCLGRILEKPHPAISHKCKQRCHRRGLTEEMDGDDGLRFRRQGVRHPLWIDIEGVPFHVHRNHRRAGHGDRQPCRHKGVRRHDHLVSWADFSRSQKEMQRIEAITHPDGVRNAAASSELSFELRNFLAADVPAAADHPQAGRFQLPQNRRVECVKIDERDAGLGERLRV